MANSLFPNRCMASPLPSIAQRVTLAIGLAGCVVLAGWLLFFGGAAVAGHFPPPLGHWRFHAPGCARLRFRHLLRPRPLYRIPISEARRKLNEVLTIVPWAFVLYILLALAGGTNQAPFAAAAITGAVFFVLGSWMNSYAEHQRHVFKQRPENYGQLYTGGLFRLVRHPNYFGDLVSFTGLCLMAGRWYTAIIPVLMFFGFVLVNVPALDQHLARHYGSAFEVYARKTRKLIPFVY